MKFQYIRRFVLAACTAVVCVCPGLALADERGSKEEASAMVDRAIEHVRKVGPEKAFADFSDKENKEWHVKDVYLFCYNAKNVNTCHGANEKLIGKDLSEMKTPDGQLLIKTMNELVAKKGSGWIEYDWPHPQTKKTEHKQAVVKKLPSGEGFLGAGIYR